MSEILIYDANGKEQGKLDIDLGIAKREVSPKTYACAIRVLRQNWRQGTVACKSRSEVSFSRKKPWKQKGTGRARAGTLRSPLWRKGGVTFGPQPRTKELSLNRKQARLALNNLLYSFLDNKKLFCLDFDLRDKPNTKAANKMLKEIGFSGKKVSLFLPFADDINFLTFRNLPNVNVFCFDQPNAFDLSNCDSWVFLKKDVDLFKAMVSTWN